MNVSVLVATFGEQRWQELGQERAVPSAMAQGAHEVRWLHLTHGTIAHVRNELAAIATGDWLCFLDADDELCPGYLEAMAKAWFEYQGPGETVMTESGPRPTRHGPLVYPPLLVPAVSYSDRAAATAAEIPAWGRPLIDVNCAVIGTLVPKHLFQRVGGFRETLNDGTPLTALEDWDLWIRCVLSGAALVPVSDAVYCAHRGADGRNLDQSCYSAIRAEHEPAWRARHTLTPPAPV